MILRIGLDVGSTTVKLVALDEAGHLVHRQYARHYSDVQQSTLAMLGKLQAECPEARLVLSVAGSAGLGLSEQTHWPFVQEVVACTEAVKQYIPETDVVIELGGEDAKIIYLTNGMEQRMNAACAGGTGAFIDQIAALLQTDAAGLNELAKGYKTEYPIASRCGVFAKTDVQPLLNEGARKEDIAASVLQSVVNQTIAGLACGRPIRGKVAFLGGPLTYLSELRRRFVETLKLKEEEVIFPENSLYFVAIGAAMNRAAREPASWEQVLAALDNLRVAGLKRTESVLPRLFADEGDLAAFREQHSRAVVPKGELSTYRGKAFLGIDAGSTTSKIVLIGERDELLFTFYENNQGKPLDSILNGLKRMYRLLPEGVEIAHAGVTGYGEQLIQAAFHVDVGEVETVAHYRAAVRFAPEVDFILDIGGQDMKCIKIRNGVIDQIILNEACSAGCGSFLESFANTLGRSVSDFSQDALLADAPVDLGTRCTVFMNSKVKQAQKEGASLANLSAGLAYSVVRNAVQKVLKLRNPEEMGRIIVVQGGTFYNEAVLRAFELWTGKEVIRPDIAGMMGAYGVALIAKERYAGERSGLLRLEELESFSYQVSHSRCRLCGNRCALTINRFNGKEVFVTGNRCERGAGKPKRQSDVPNLYQYKYDRLFGYESLDEEKAWRGTVGIPRVLNMYENYPLWHTFFTELGYRVLLSPPSSKSLYERGIESIPSDTVCYPAKLVHGHIQSLAEAGVDFVFYPSVVFERKEAEEASNHFNCPVVASYPEVVRVNMDVLREKGVPLVQPFLTLDNRKALEQELCRQFAQIPAREIRRALELGLKELERVKEDLRRKGEETLEYLKRTGKRGIVLAGRPYHADTEIHHGIPELITGFGVAVLTEDSIAHLAPAEQDSRVVNQWTYHSRLYRAARVVAREPLLELVQLTSFGCGLDAITSDAVQSILESRRKMYTLLKIDEINNLGSVRIRIRSLLAAMRERENRQVPCAAVAPAEPENTKPVLFTKEMKPDYTILIPQMAPIHFELYEEAVRSVGYRVELLPEVTPDMIETGLKYVNNDACYPAIVTIGQLVHALKSGKYDLDRTAVIMSQTGGACRATNYISLLRRGLREAGMPQVPVISLNAAGLEKHPGFSLTLPLVRRLAAATVFGDGLMRMLLRVRPYEEEEGSANRLFRRWMDEGKRLFVDFRMSTFHEMLAGMVDDFDRLPLREARKPRIGVVGEILVKFHPGANNDIVAAIEREGAEAVVPDMMEFFLYCAYNQIYKGRHLGKSRLRVPLGHGLVALLEQFRKPLVDALSQSERFTAPESIHRKAERASRLLSLGNQAGEGWLLTAEMMALIEEGVLNIACVQPFACLPNHITGRGMLKGLKRMYPEANITAIDYDSSGSEVNQLNRLKLMISAAMSGFGQEPAPGFQAEPAPGFSRDKPTPKLKQEPVNVH